MDFDLLHELFHPAERPEDPHFGVYEDGIPNQEDEIERIANAYAGNAVLRGQAEPLASLSTTTLRPRTRQTAPWNSPRSSSGKYLMPVRGIGRNRLWRIRIDAIGDKLGQVAGVHLARG